jgi:endonuclease YncB( thermonuclease family)
VRSCGRRLALIAAVVFSCPGNAIAQTSAPLPCALEPGPTRAVASVSSGDTIRLDDGVEVRLLGILAPKARDAGLSSAGTKWPPAADAREALAALVGGRSVALAFVNNGERTDRYRRVLAHLFVDTGGQQTWVQGRLVAQGQARAHALPRTPAPCHAALVALERQARAAGLGLWSHAAYQVRPADRPSELARYRNSFQLVRGRVERTRRTRRLAILELASSEKPPAPEGRSQWGAFHVIWWRSAADKLKLPELASLTGRNVLVRGWVQQRPGRGPEIELVAAGQLEFED